MLSDGLGYCQGPQDFDTDFDEDTVCYTVKSGDTLWGIAETYLENGAKWRELEVSYAYRKKQDAPTYVTNPRLLQVGTKIAFNTSRLTPYSRYDFVDGSAIVDPQTGGLITWSRNRDGQGVLNIGDKIYAGPYAFMKHLRASQDGKNISYLADTKKGNCSGEAHGYQFFVNGTANEQYSCGYDYKLLTYSPDGSAYAVRNNVGSKPEQFFILSNIGNGVKYDYIDSLLWVDNKTLVYRAQTNDQWRVVVNHQDYAVYDYLENLKGENGVVSFDARHDDQSWTHEILTLTGK